MKSIARHESETKAIARGFASTILIGDVILITGDLGSGKTLMCQEIIRYFMSSQQVVTSPTFNIVQIYQNDNFSIYHFDLYRLKSEDELLELGIEDAISTNAICLIEWPEIAFGFFQRQKLKTKQIHIDILDLDKRSIIIG